MRRSMLAIYKLNLDILILDYTYKTNRYNMPLLYVLRVTRNNYNIPLSIVFIRDK
jgi:hypothetical protein